MGFKAPLNMKNINNFTPVKKWISRCNDHVRDHTHIRAVCGEQWKFSNINTLGVFTKTPIREQEVKLECMNIY